MLRSLLFAAAALAALSVSADGWSRGPDEHHRTLAYSGNATVLGHETRLDASFYCSTERTKMATGAIGFDVEIAHPDTIKEFHFDDFEGPDAPSLKRKLLTATVVHADGTRQNFEASPTGWYSVHEGFAFEVSDVFYRKGSTARRILEALAKDASALTLVVTDYRVSSIRLELTIPVAGRGDDFRWLLAQLPPQPPLTYSSTFFASTSSGTLPPMTTVSSNAFRSNFAASTAFALSR
jgi:hypothetical protein